MYVQAKIRSVTVSRRNPEKPTARISIETKAPLQIMTITLFKDDILSGLVEDITKLQDKSVLLPLECDVYQNQVQYRMARDEEIKVVQEAKS